MGHSPLLDGFDNRPYYEQLAREDEAWTLEAAEAAAQKAGEALDEGQRAHDWRRAGAPTARQLDVLREEYETARDRLARIRDREGG